MKFLFIICFMGANFISFAQESNCQQGFIKVDEGCLYYSEWGHGIPIVVVHGGPGLDQEYLKPQVLKLAAEHRLIFYDQRGSGKSLDTKWDENLFNIHQFVEDLETLRKTLGLEKFVLLGHSWGGLLAMHYAIDHQEHLMGLILLSTAPADYKGQKAFDDAFELRTKAFHNDIKAFFTYEDFKVLNAAQIAALYRKIFSFYFYESKGVDDLSLNFTIESAHSGYKAMGEILKTSWLQPINLFSHLKNLTVPTFILHGKQDLVPVWTAEEIKNAIPQAEIILIDHCGHFPYIEHPYQVFYEINKFLKKNTW